MTSDQPTPGTSVQYPPVAAEGHGRFPHIVGHRGASRDACENTIRAFELALEQGADGIELDVHGSSDGILVVHHDPAIRLDGPTSPLQPIASLPTSVLTAHRMASGDTIPTLESVFELIGTRATVYVEVKGRGLEEEVARLLDRFPQVDSAVHAFDHRIPARVRALRPQTPIGLLSTSYPLSLMSFLAGSGARTLWQHVEQIDEALVLEAHTLGVEIMAWTANDTPHARQLAAWGVDGLCTDIPGVMRSAVYSAG
ncbi:MAG: glycerophosphodiester phosphodiesterase [Gemmatimonadaceae bacterium]|nr:glycerophosphodiester phosphodiesterase [Gemmatimonadaceae bacterium]